MLPTELEEQINELESRVDRLRALYEQYFMGIEKMEPQVARKDVDRRIVTIRREQIRNTAIRYRFHMILQRYNTFQSYWMRICREIEEGTYKRHLIRAGNKFGEVAATRALPKWHRRRFAKKSAAEDGTDELDMADAAESEATLAKSAPPVPNAAKKPPPPPLPMRAGAPAKPPNLPGAAPTSPSPLSSAAASAPRAAPSDGEATKEGRMRELARRLNEKKAASASDGASPLAAPAVPAATTPVAVTASSRTTPSPPRPTPAVAVAPKPAPVAAAPPAPAQPAAAAPPARAPAPAPAPASPAPSGARDISEERMRQLYSELVETKRKQKESTAAVTYDALAKSLRESSAKLKEKHGGRSVDFEVTIKDGKTILRPVVK